MQLHSLRSSSSPYSHRRLRSRRAAHETRCRRSTAPLLSAASPAPRVPLIRRNSYRVATVTSLIALDILFYAFPLPFLPQHLSAAGHSAASISMLLASTSYAALFVGSGLVLVESRRRVPRSERRCLFLIAACAVAMTACAAAQAALPVYTVLLVCRLVAGGVSQTVWSFGLALAASLGPSRGSRRRRAWRQLLGDPGRSLARRSSHGRRPAATPSPRRWRRHRRRARRRRRRRRAARAPAAEADARG